MKKTTALIFTFFIILNGYGFVLAGNPDTEAASGADAFQALLSAEIINAPIPPSVLQSPYSLAFFLDSPNDSAQFAGASGVPHPAHFSESAGFRHVPPLTDESIIRGRKSFPEASKMLLLGLGLIGVAGYGGRKKFKR